MTIVHLGNVSIQFPVKSNMIVIKQYNLHDQIHHTKRSNIQASNTNKADNKATKLGATGRQDYHKHINPHPINIRSNGGIYNNHHAVQRNRNSFYSCDNRTLVLHKGSAKEITINTTQVRCTYIDQQRIQPRICTKRVLLLHHPFLLLFLPSFLLLLPSTKMEGAQGGRAPLCGKRGGRSLSPIIAVDLHHLRQTSLRAGKHYVFQKVIRYQEVL